MTFNPSSLRNISAQCISELKLGCNVLKNVQGTTFMSTSDRIREWLDNSLDAQSRSAKISLLGVFGTPVLLSDDNRDRLADPGRERVIHRFLVLEDDGVGLTNGLDDFNVVGVKHKVTLDHGEYGQGKFGPLGAGKEVLLASAWLDPRTQERKFVLALYSESVNKNEKKKKNEPAKTYQCIRIEFTLQEMGSDFSFNVLRESDPVRYKTLGHVMQFVWIVLRLRDAKQLNGANDGGWLGENDDSHVAPSFNVANDNYPIGKGKVKATVKELKAFGAMIFGRFGSGCGVSLFIARMDVRLVAVTRPNDFDRVRSVFYYENEDGPIKKDEEETALDRRCNRPANKTVEDIFVCRSNVFSSAPNMDKIAFREGHLLLRKEEASLGSDILRTLSKRSDIRQGWSGRSDLIYVNDQRSITKTIQSNYARDIPARVLVQGVLARNGASRSRMGVIERFGQSLGINETTAEVFDATGDVFESINSKRSKSNLKRLSPENVSIKFLYGFAQTTSTFREPGIKFALNGKFIGGLKLDDSKQSAIIARNFNFKKNLKNNYHLLAAVAIEMREGTRNSTAEFFFADVKKQHFVNEGDFLQLIKDSLMARMNVFAENNPKHLMVVALAGSKRQSKSVVVRKSARQNGEDVVSDGKRKRSERIQKRKRGDAEALRSAAKRGRAYIIPPRFMCILCDKVLPQPKVALYLFNKRRVPMVCRSGKCFDALLEGKSAKEKEEILSNVQKNAVLADAATLQCSEDAQLLLNYCGNSHKAIASKIRYLDGKK